MSGSNGDGVAGKNPFEFLAGLCSEAVARHGSDWPAIERYVTDQLQKLKADDRALFISKLEELLDFATPKPPTDSTH